MGALFLAGNGIGFDFHQHLIIDQAPNFDHSRAWQHDAKEFAMCSSVLLPPRYVGHEEPRAHDIGGRSTQRAERTLDVAENLDSLQIGIAYTDDFSLLIGCRRARDEYQVTLTDGPRIPDDF